MCETCEATEEAEAEIARLKDRLATAEGISASARKNYEELRQRFDECQRQLSAAQSETATALATRNAYKTKLDEHEQYLNQSATIDKLIDIVARLAGGSSEY